MMEAPGLRCGTAYLKPKSVGELRGLCLRDSLGQGDHGNDVGLEGALDIAELRSESDDGLYPVYITLTSMSWMASHMICLEALLTRISSLP